MSITLYREFVCTNIIFYHSARVCTCTCLYYIYVFICIGLCCYKYISITVNNEILFQTLDPWNIPYYTDIESNYIYSGHVSNQ